MMWPMDAYPPPIMPHNLFLLNTNIFKYICIIIETWSINTNLPPTLVISVSILYYIYWQPFIQSTLTGWSTHFHSGVFWECFWGHSLTLVHSETSLLLNLTVTTKCRTVKWMQLLLKTSDELPRSTTSELNWSENTTADIMSLSELLLLFFCVLCVCSCWAKFFQLVSAVCSIQFVMGMLVQLLFPSVCHFVTSLSESAETCGA